MIFDFDGTIIQGDQPYYRCAEIISKQLPSSVVEPFLSKVKAALTHSMPFPGEDGWSMLYNLSSNYITRDEFSAAFHLTRREMLEDEKMTYMPDAVKVLLESLKKSAILVLASNSPAAYVEPVVRRYSLDDYFSYIRPGAAKPAGFEPMVRQVIENEKLDRGYKVLSVGDHYTNDIMPAVKLGWDGAYVNPYGLAPKESTVSGGSIEELSPWIIDWAMK
ncbi:MAG: HAD family hydrolase [Candidatus Thermoplasmatota archaeon]|nr:HAD family hydrolase [Candidatus Thermoplasmatota archaeon]